MAYERLNLIDDDVLEAEHISHMEDGIERASEWENITGKPFTASTTNVLTWNGDITDKELVGEMFAKISDEVVSPEALAQGGSVTVPAFAEIGLSVTTAVWTAEDVIEVMPGAFTVMPAAFVGISVLSVLCVQTPITDPDVGTLNPGVYFLYMSESESFALYTTEVVFNGYTFSSGEIINSEALPPALRFGAKYRDGREIVTPISEKYLPANVRGDYLNAVFLKAQNPTAQGSFSMNRKPETKIGNQSHAEGDGCTASAWGSHAEGHWTIASGSMSHAEGNESQATSESSHAEGNRTSARGWASHAEGNNTTAGSKYQHVQGKYNISDNQDKYAHIVGNGEDDYAFSNAHTLDWAGNAWYAGDVYVGSTSGTNKDKGSKKLIDEDDIIANPAKYLPEGTPWVGETIEEVYPETTLTMGEDGYPVPQPFAVKIGERFIVTIDGVNYNSSVVNGRTIGGPSVPVLINDGGSFAEPVKSKFAIMFFDPENVIVQPFSGVPVPNPFNLTVRKINTVVRPIDVKCLPEGTPYTAEGELLYEFNYDGVSTGKVTTTFLVGQYVKISDLTPAAAELLGATIVIAQADPFVGGFIEETYVATEANDVTGDGGAVMLLSSSGNFAVVIYKTGFYINGDFPETGLYVYAVDGAVFVKTIYKKEAIIQPVDPRCIVLASPNGTKFNLTVSDDGTLGATPVS